MLASTSGRSMAGLRIEPRSPPVHVATTTSTPSATYLAVVAAPLLDSSSGCACTCSSRSRSPAASVRGSAGVHSRPCCHRPAEGRGPPRRSRQARSRATMGEWRRRGRTQVVGGGRRADPAAGIPRPRIPRPVLVGADRGRRARRRRLADLGGASVRANPPVSARISAYTVQSDTRITATLTVDRPDPARPVACRVLAQAPTSSRWPSSSCRCAASAVPGRQRRGGPDDSAPRHHRRGQGVFSDLTARGRNCYAGSMSENVQQAVWLTQEAYDKLRSELDQLSGSGSRRGHGQDRRRA